ncbi:YcdB/YcdC domain-containing protein [Ureibacillus chungkukjangi]|uniref:Uncharacterized protein DUF4901 n=1 Tax=Ureibacillus chungkukjangi TaxID=1202712 RepID=A0A318TTZ1_9BACL|nr:YcdB/YcdC domain-containing protein [Ureibacillus chungkukjangi]PYF08326.1 uncharacterized protein DUF4901 [Ureibacillus chungkukjangi]
MNKDQLKERALSLIELPDHLNPLIEEVAEDENGEGQAIFTWADEQQEEGISVSLDLNGNLTSLSIERNEPTNGVFSLNETQLKEKAEQFLSSHYPHALQKVTLFTTQKVEGAYRFNYEQIVMGLSLPRTGFYIDVEPSGEVIGFEYFGIKDEPSIPETLIEKEKLFQHVQTQLDFKPLIANLNSAIHDVRKEGLQLVYDIDLLMNYKADTAQPTLTIIHDEDSPSQYVPLPKADTVAKEEASIEEVIGIPAEMEVIRKVELEKEVGIVWRERGWKQSKKDLSVDSFLQSHNEDTVKAFISKDSEKVRGFVWFKERNGDLCLDREECYEKALDFLQMLIPNFYQCLQLKVHDNEEDFEEARAKETFSFRVQSKQGIQIFLELVIVSVNRHTGLIDYYSGPSFDFDQLEHIPAAPVTSKEEAHKIFLKSLDFELAWDKNYGDEDGENEEYSLIYRACDHHTKRAIRYIDAMTGAIILEKE